MKRAMQAVLRRVLAVPETTRKHPACLVLKKYYLSNAFIPNKQVQTRAKFLRTKGSSKEKPTKRFLVCDNMNGSSPCSILRQIEMRVSPKSPIVKSTQQTSSLLTLSQRFCKSYLSTSERYPLYWDDTIETLKYFALELGGPNISLNDVDNAIQSYSREEEVSEGSIQDIAIRKRMRKESILQERIRALCTPRYEKIISIIVTQTSQSDTALGMKFVIQLRHDLLSLIKYLRQDELQSQENKEFLLFRLKTINDDVKRMLSAWFSAGILELRRITYETTPASIIEVIARREAVHPIKDLSDLRNRLSNPSRRCFAFFHPSLPGDPLVFVHVALVPHIPSSMEELDHMTDIKFANDNLPKKVASFYSINNTQKGLSGVELGNFLIKRVVEVLRKEPAWNLDTFATLSPLPGFRLWFRLKVMMQIELHKSNQANNHIDIQMRNKFAEEFVSMCEIKELAKVFKTHDPAQTLESLLDILEGKTWYLDENLADSLKSVLMKHAAVYLAREKRRGKPLDPVANFHLSNGAEMYRLNYLADNSRTGMHNSYGIMVNYHYDVTKMYSNQQRFEYAGPVPLGDEMKSWLPDDDIPLANL